MLNYFGFLKTSEPEEKSIQDFIDGVEGPTHQHH